MVLLFSTTAKPALAARLHDDSCHLVRAAELSKGRVKVRREDLASEVADLNERGFRVKKCKCLRPRAETPEASAARRQAETFQSVASVVEAAGGAFAAVLSIGSAIAKALKPHLEPGEVEVLPELRKCPKCGWRAGEEIRTGIRCPQCDTYMPFVGSRVVKPGS